MLDLRDTDTGKVSCMSRPCDLALLSGIPAESFRTLLRLCGAYVQVIISQYDHTLVVESILYHQFPRLGKFANKHILPTIGEHAGLTGTLYAI